MLLIDSLAEERIAAAIRRGEFADLPGQGKPLALDDDSGVPEALRVAYRILKNAGCLPPELSIRNEIHRLETLLAGLETDEAQESARRRLCLLRARLAASGGESSLLALDAEYRAKIVARLAGQGRR